MSCPSPEFPHHLYLWPALLFDTIENAKKEATIYLQNYITELYRFYGQPYNILWQYETTKFQTWVYMMKFGIIGPVIIILLSCILPLCGESNWNILWLSGGCSLFAMIVASILVLTGYNPITYEVTDKGIITCKGIYHECSYDNIKNIKLKRSMFNKNKGSIKLKLHKGSSINYNFDNIENPEEVYKIIEEQMNK